MLDFAAIATPRAYLFWGGAKWMSPRVVVVCAVAVAAAIAGVAGGGWDGVAYADGGASPRSQTTAAAPDESGATIQVYAQRILRALADDDANKWVRYWQARADCDAFASTPPASRARALLALTASICAQLDALLAVNPAAHMSHGEDRTVGLLLNEPGAAAGYTLFKSQRGHDIFLIDPLGRVAHAWRLTRSFIDAKLLDNGNLLAIEGGGIFEFDPRGNIVWQYNICCLHHDFLKMPNGNVLLLVSEIKTREEAIAAGANPQFVHKKGLGYDYLLEARPAGANGGEVVWEWSPWDHLVQDFDPSKPNYGAIAEHPELIDINFLLETISKRRKHRPLDWLHTNAIDYNPELDQIMLSPRHFSELWIIDHSATTEEARGHSGGNGGMGGDLLYRWGNPRAYGYGDADDQRLFWQHNTHWIAPGLPGAGNVLLFNNGMEFSGDERFHSSIDELYPPVDGYRYHRAQHAAYPPAKLAWTYAAGRPADFYAPIYSGVQRLPNGNTLIADGTAGTIFQVTPDGKPVWKYVSPLDKRARLRQGERASVQKIYPTAHSDPAPLLANAVYRAYWYPPDHPGLQALDLTPGAYIEDLPDIYDAARNAVIAGALGEPLVSSDFDIYPDDGNLIYFKMPCAAEDTQARFFLHIIPADARDLPAARQEHGFDTMNFGFRNRGKISDDWCIAVLSLPAYPIERIRTGQFTGKGALWRAEIGLGE